jgi:hypothetical protein
MLNSDRRTLKQLRYTLHTCSILSMNNKWPVGILARLERRGDYKVAG